MIHLLTSPNFEVWGLYGEQAGHFRKCINGNCWSVCKKLYHIVEGVMQQEHGGRSDSFHSLLVPRLFSALTAISQKSRQLIWVLPWSFKKQCSSSARQSSVMRAPHLSQGFTGPRAEPVLCSGCVRAFLHFSALHRGVGTSCTELSTKRPNRMASPSLFFLLLGIINTVMKKKGHIQMAGIKELLFNASQ